MCEGEDCALEGNQEATVGEMLNLFGVGVLWSEMFRSWRGDEVFTGPFRSAVGRDSCLLPQRVSLARGIRLRARVTARSESRREDSTEKFIVESPAGKKVTKLMFLRYSSEWNFFVGRRRADDVMPAADMEIECPEVKWMNECHAPRTLASRVSRNNKHALEL